MYVQVGWWSEALSYSFLVFVFLESLKIFCQVWLLALVRLDQSPSCPRCLVLQPRRGRVCEAAQKVRFPFLSLNLSKTMNLFWSGEFCSGGKKKKENPTKPGAVPFLVFELVENYEFVLVRWIFFRGQKKERKSCEARCGSLSCLWTCRNQVSTIDRRAPPEAC